MKERNQPSSSTSDFYGTTVTLPQRKDRKGMMYDRTIQYQPGMKELTDIVAKLQKDVKRFNQCVTLVGAEKYAANKGDNWSAFAADVTGPNGAKDGIEEIFVADGNGNVRIVNGVGLAKSDYPMRKAYQTIYPTKAARSENTYSDFRKHGHELTEVTNSETGEVDWTYANKMSDIGDEYKYLQNAITPKEVFKQYLFKDVYDGNKDTFISEGLTGIYLAQTYNKGLSESYKELVIKPLAEQLHINESMIDLPKSKKLFSKHLDSQMNIVNTLYAEQDNTKADIDGILGFVAGEMFNKQTAAAERPEEEVPSSPERAFHTTSPGRPTYVPKNVWKSPTKN